jgi:hypothetical protein
VDVRPVPGVVFKQLTARDLVSRWDVIQAHTRATAFAATQFLDFRRNRRRDRDGLVCISGIAE